MIPSKGINDFEVKIYFIPLDNEIVLIIKYWIFEIIHLFIIRKLEWSGNFNYPFLGIQ